MCLAIPGRLVEISAGAGLDRTGIIDTDGIRREVNLGMVPGAAVGDSVITHSGFAIRIVPHDLLDIPETAELSAELGVPFGVGISVSNSLDDEGGHQHDGHLDE